MDTDDSSHDVVDDVDDDVQLHSSSSDDEEELKIMVQKTRIIRCTIPLGNCKFSAVSVMSEKELLLFSNKKQTPVSLKALMETGKGDRLSSSSHDKNEDASRSKILIQIACFLHRELPVRLAHNAVKFEASPLIMKSGSTVLNNSCSFFLKICSLRYILQ
jgi:hypothetical protein